MGYGLHQLADTLLYQEYAVAFSFGRWPDSGVPVEYPPLANLVFLFGPARASVATYEAWFGAGDDRRDAGGRRTDHSGGRARLALAAARRSWSRRPTPFSRSSAGPWR